MIRYVFSFILLFSMLFSNIVVFSDIEIKEINLYYSDRDNNWKVDNLELEFNDYLNWELNLEKIFFYSNTGWLSIQKLDWINWNEIIENYYLSWNILWINLIEQDNYLTWLTIDNSTSSHLRLKTNAWIWILGNSWEEIKLLYTKSFNNYKNTFFIENNIISYEENINETLTWVLLEEEIIENTESDMLLNWTWTLENNEDLIITNTWPDNDIQNNEKENTNTWFLIVENDEEIWLSNEIIVENSDTWTLLDEKTWSWIPEKELLTLNNTQTQTIETQIFTWTIVLQSPSYLEDTWESKYICDSSKDECKVNYKLQIDEWSWFWDIWNDYECLWDFWIWEPTQEEEKCNPNTIVYPIWNFETTYKIIEKTNTWNYFEKRIFITNTWKKEEQKSKTIYINSSWNSSYPISISKPEINIQSWLDENNNCKKEKCSINFEYKIKNSKERCKWDFWSWYLTWDEEKCNPSYINYWTWDYQVTLRVYELWNETNYKESTFSFSNKINTKNINIWNNLINEEEINEIFENEIKAKIKFQWKVTSSKTLSWNTITCDDICSLNFTWEDSIWRKLKYFWDFGNWEFFEWKNPKSINYSFWEYSILLKVIDEKGLEDNDYFYVKVFDKKTQEKQNIQEVDLSKFTLRISNTLPNPYWPEELEFIELENYWDESIDLSWCTLDDKKDSWSKKYKLDWYIIKPKESRKFYKFETKISLNNSQEEVNLECFWKTIDLLGINYKYPEWFIIKPNIKNISEVKKSKEKWNFEIIYSNWERDEISQKYDSKVFENILEKELKKDEKIEIIRKVVNSSFSQSLKQNEDWLEISWTSVPNSTIIVELNKISLDKDFSFFNFLVPSVYASNDKYEVLVDDNWNYEKFVNNLDNWEYEIKNFIKLNDDNFLEINEVSSFDFQAKENNNININNNTSILNNEVKSIITLQWKLWDNKKVEWNKITCLYVETCSINFDWRESVWKKLSYFWDYWSWITFDKSNPSSFKFSPWKHLVSLKVSSENKSDISYFQVEVINDELEYEEKQTKKEISNNLFVQNANAWNIDNDKIYISIDKKSVYILSLLLVMLFLSFVILRRYKII